MSIGHAFGFAARDRSDVRAFDGAGARDQLLTIQLLRAVAALMVVVFHVAQSWTSDLGLTAKNIFPMGSDGVDIFFVISGFIMCYTTHDAERTSPWDFAAKRLARILPLYWGLTLGVFGLALVAPSLLASTSADPGFLIKSLLFVPYAREDGSVYPILFLGWTLNYEMFFYAVFVIALAFGRYAHLLVVAAMTGLALLGHWARPEGVLASFYTNDIVLEFVWGCLLFMAWNRWPEVFRRLWPLAIVGFGLLIAQNLHPWPLPRSISKGLPALMIVAGLIELRIPASWIRSWAVRVGDASYSIYLVHPFVVELLAKALVILIGASVLAGALLLVLSLAVTVLASLILFACWERPSNGVLRRLLLPAGRSVSAGS